MVVVGQGFRFEDDDPRPMLRHLDGWARRRLGSPDGWGVLLERCGQWADYSARNQVLLASYGVASPVAGAVTWSRVPSVDPGFECAVRVGEHGLPVRVPVVGDGVVESDRSRFAARSSAVAGGHRWEFVFAAEQLARQPAVGALVPVRVPALSGAEWVEVVRVASGRVVGRTPRRVGDPAEQLAGLAARVSFQSGRRPLGEALAAQAGWLVADRVGLAEGGLPVFDPSALPVRERWQRLVEVRHAAGGVWAGVSFALGVDLAGSVLPRHGLVEDRTVPAGRRNYLAAADLRGLPVGVWVEVGPYNRSEWLARGVPQASGVGAFLRVTDRSYLAVYEARGGALWRWETVGRGAHQGLLAQGSADGLDAAKDAARLALAHRFPEVAAAVESPVSTRVASAGSGWSALAGGRDDRTERRVLDERVQAVVSPGPGGRWETWVSVDGVLRQGPLAGSRELARAAADRLAGRALGELARFSPERADRVVADLAATPAVWDRQVVVDAVGHRLTDRDRATLATTTDAGELVEVLRASGVLRGATMLAVLHAEGVDAATVGGLVPVLGVPVAEAIGVLCDRWGLDRLDAGAAVGATVEELRAAGCTPAELLAAAPRETLRGFDGRESTWVVAAATLLEAGYTRAEAVAHLFAHAPSPAACAAGVAAIVDDPADAFALAGRRALPEDLAAVSVRFGLDPVATAEALCEAGITPVTVAEVVALRCDGDLERAAELIAGVVTSGSSVEVNDLVTALTSRGIGVGDTG